MKKVLLPILVLVLALGLAMPAAANNGLVDPPEVSGDIETGASMEVTKYVTTTPIPPNPDIYFMSDTTGSMGPSIAAVQANAGAIMAAIVAAQATAQFGVGNYKDYPYDPYAFQHQQAITAIQADVLTAIGLWSASGGGDGPEAQFYALDRLAEGSGIGWRAATNKIVVWFGDAPAHDPVPIAATGLLADITEATVTAALQAAGIKVVAISLNTGGYPAGTDDDPNLFGGDYAFAYGTVEDGTPGQASRIAAATGGVYFLAPTPEAAADAVVGLIEELTTDVWWEVTASDPGLTVSLDPAVHYGVAGDATVEFVETITVAIDATPCTYLLATVTFYANEFDREGVVLGEETISIHVIGVPVEIDIKPGSYPNSINLKNKGVVPVALLGSDTFDVAMVDVDTLMFAPAGSAWLSGATPAHAEVHYEDVNMDGYVDLVSHYRQMEIGLAPDTEEACLRGRFLDGRAFEGCDSVRIVPPK